MISEETRERFSALGAACMMFVALLVDPGCGGGTSGTGGRNFSGTVVRTDGSPARNVRVEVENSPDGTVTDEEGQFDFESSVAPGEVSLRVVDGPVSDSIVAVVPQEAVEVRLDLVFDSSPAEAQIVSADIEVIGNGQVTVSPTPTNPPEPTPTPTPTSGTGGVRCGPNVCVAGEVCCNESCGICTPPGGACTQQFCLGTPTPTPPNGTGPVCGPNVCAAGEVCCNESCGICTPPGGACIELFCGDNI